MAAAILRDAGRPFRQEAVAGDLLSNRAAMAGPRQACSARAAYGQSAHPPREPAGRQPIFFFRFSSSFARNAWVLSQGWSLLIRIARSFVM